MRTCREQLIHSKYRFPSALELVGVFAPVPLGSPFDEGVPDLEGAGRPWLEEAELFNDGGT